MATAMGTDHMLNTTNSISGLKEASLKLQLANVSFLI